MQTFARPLMLVSYKVAAKSSCKQVGSAFVQCLARNRDWDIGDLRVERGPQGMLMICCESSCEQVRITILAAAVVARTTVPTIILTTATARRRRTSKKNLKPSKESIISQAPSASCSWSRPSWSQGIFASSWTLCINGLHLEAIMFMNCSREVQGPNVEDSSSKLH